MWNYFKRFEGLGLELLLHVNKYHYELGGKKMGFFFSLNQKKKKIWKVPIKIFRP